VRSERGSARGESRRLAPRREARDDGGVALRDADRSRELRALPRRSELATRDSDAIERGRSVRGDASRDPRALPRRTSAPQDGYRMPRSAPRDYQARRSYEAPREYERADATRQRSS